MRKWIGNGGMNFQLVFFVLNRILGSPHLTGEQKVFVWSILGKDAPSSAGKISLKLHHDLVYFCGDETIVPVALTF